MIFEWQDAINGGIELLGTLVVLLSARKVYKDRAATGVHASHVGYTLAVNFWCVYYYLHIKQPISFWCGVALSSAALLWAAMIWKHRGAYDDGTG